MKDIQLFCIPYAGGNASFFNNLKKYLEDSVEVYNLEYSGHGIRRREAFYHDFEELLIEVKEQIETHRKKDVPYAILGYSMGSLAAYELAFTHPETGESMIFQHNPSGGIFRQFQMPGQQ